jgi:hypothetical protein
VGAEQWRSTTEPLPHPQFAAGLEGGDQRAGGRAEHWWLRAGRWEGGGGKRRWRVNGDQAAARRESECRYCAPRGEREGNKIARTNFCWF